GQPGVPLAYATVTQIGPASMEGHLDLHAGDWIAAGYSLAMPGAHPEATVLVSDATVTLPIRCADNGAAIGQIVIGLTSGPLSSKPRPYTIPAGSGAWFPTGDPDSPSS